MNWKEIVNRIFPRQVSNNFQGYRIASIIFLLIIAVTIARSCVHISRLMRCRQYRRIIVSLKAGQTLFPYSHYGLIATSYGICLSRCLHPLQEFNPLYVSAHNSRILRTRFDRIYKASAGNTYSPGAIGDYILIPLALIMLILSLKSPKKLVNQTDAFTNRKK